MNGFLCEPMAPHHERAEFNCGVPVLDACLRTMASQDSRRRAAAVFVMVPKAEPNRIAGFYTLAASSIELTSVPESLRKRLARYPHVPAILIGRLAREAAFPGIGKLLLLDALQRSVLHSDEIGAAAVIGDAKDERAAAFYSRFGFMPILDNLRRMFLLMKTVEQLFDTGSGKR